MQPSVHTIDPTLDFAEELVKGIHDRLQGDTFALADTVIYVPNRRAVRSVREAFLRHGGGQASLLPVIRPIGDVDEEEIMFLGSGTGINPSTVLPAIAPVRRLVLLARFVTTAFGEEISLTQAWRLAGELARLMDQLDTEEITYSALDKIVPEELAEHWAHVVNFLGLVFLHWQSILDEEKGINPAHRRTQLLSRLSAHLQTRQPKSLIIAAGSTGSIPATAALLKTICTLENGHVVLPGFDTTLSDTAWQVLDTDPSHPQHMMQKLLESMAVNRFEVEQWTTTPSEPDRMLRLKSLRSALMTASLTDAWQLDDPYEDVGGIELLVANDRQEEAAAIALMLREVLETPEKTAALVTPDRLLARYVRMELLRFNITIDDTGGDRALMSVPGRLLLQIADCISCAFSPLSFLAVLQHPLVCAGRPRGEILALVRRLDKYILRGTRPAAGSAGILERSRAASQDGRNPYSAADHAELKRIMDPLLDFEAVTQQEDVTLKDYIQAHILATESLCTSDTQGGEELLWKGEAGQALAAALSDILQGGDALPVRMAAGYESLFAEILNPVVVRPVWNKHPRLFIWGPLEARMQRADRMILGGLNEGVWPGTLGKDPWMNRSMRSTVGLPSAERRIGQSAHDFIQAANAPEVFLSRAKKQDGTPTVPSRWLFRIEALLGRSLPSAERYHTWAKMLIKPSAYTPLPPPAPTPPLSARPKELSVTQVETWLRDPYALYASKILNLQKLDAFEESPSGRHKGTMIHDALEMFLKPKDHCSEMLAMHGYLHAAKMLLNL